MKQQANGSLHFVLTAIALSVSLSLGAAALAQPRNQGQTGPQTATTEGSTRIPGRNGEEEAAPSTDISARTGEILNKAIEALNAENYQAAADAIGTLKLENLSPYERGRVEQILVNIALSQDKYEEARGHLQKAIDSGGLNAQEIEQARYQNAVLYIQEEKWREGAAALDEWFTTATSPNSAAYYLLAAAYYQLEDLNRALPPAQKAVGSWTKPSRTRAGSACSRRSICTVRNIARRYRC